MAQKRPLIESLSIRSMLVSRGVPEGVVHAPFPEHYEHAITRIDMNPTINLNRPVSVQKQLDFIKATKKKPFDSNYLMVISGQTNDHLAQQIGLMVFLEAVKTAANMESKPRVLWKNMYGGFDNDLQELANGGPLGLLVLSNLFANSTMPKVERTRDILSRYAHIPRILVMAGTDPITYCSTVLYTRASRVVYFGTSNGS